MTLDRFKEVLTEMNYEESICNQFSQLDVDLAYNWIKNRLACNCCTCCYDEEDIEKAVVYRAVLLNEQAPQDEVNNVDEDCLDYLQVNLGYSY